MKTLAYITLTGRTSSEKDEARALQKYFQEFDVVVILTFEAKLLKSLNIVSHVLQSPDCEFSKAADLLRSAIIRVVEEMRSHFDEILQNAEETAKSWGISALLHIKS